MISKHIPRTTKSSFKRLAKYIAGAEEEGEKLSDFWIVNSIAGETLDDLDLAIIDIENTQSKNTRCKVDKTYHLLVSFKDEKPDLKTLKVIEKEFAKALGIETHQRVVGTHQNTDNFHMHIAYNKINPETFRVATLSNDYYKRSKVCHEMEKKYNLKVDNGIEKTQTLNYEKPHEKARDFEAKTWQQSFYSYVKEKKEPLTKALSQAHKWQDLHNAFEAEGLLLKKRGNGLAIVSKDEKIAIKASDLDRVFSKNALEKRLGKFEESTQTAEPKRTYTEKPLTKHPNTETLWQKYQEVKKKPEQNKQQSLLKKAFYTWKDFLMAEALKDPFAMAIIIAQKKLINAIFLNFGKNSKPIAEHYKPEKPAKEPDIFFVEMPQKPENQEAIKSITKYDNEHKFYYLEDGKDAATKIIAIEELGGKVSIPAELYDKTYGKVKEERTKNETIDNMMKELKPELKKDDETYQAIKETLKTNDEFYQKMHESYEKHLEEKELALKRSKGYGFGMGM